jgi:hypothetical protein
MPAAHSRTESSRVAEDQSSQVLVCQAEKSRGLGVTQERGEELASEPDEAVLVNRVFDPCDCQDGNQGLVVGGGRIRAKQGVPRITDCPAQAAQDVYDTDSLSCLQRPRRTHSAVSSCFRLAGEIP